MEFHFDEYKQLDGLLVSLNDITTQLITLHEGKYIPPNKLKNQFDDIVNHGSQILQHIKTLLQTVKSSIKPHETLLFDRNARRAKEVILRYQRELASYRSMEYESSKRQLKYLNIPDEKIEQIIEHDLQVQVLQNYLISEDLDNVVEQIETRHHRIVHLEKSIEELKSLFVDLAFLIDEQGECLNNIEHHISVGKDVTQKGERDLVTADKINKKSRKCMCIIFLILICMFSVIFIPFAALKKI